MSLTAALWEAHNRCLPGLVAPFPLPFGDCEFDSPPMVEGAEWFEVAPMGMTPPSGFTDERRPDPPRS